MRTTRSTVVAALAAVWMTALLVRDVFFGELGGFSLFAAFVLAVAVWELAKPRASDTDG